MTREEFDLVYETMVVADAHGDIYQFNHLVNSGSGDPLGESILPDLRSANVGVLGLAVGGDSYKHSNNVDLPLLGTLSNLSRFINEIERHRTGARIILSRSDLPVEPEPAVSFVLTLEGGRPLCGSLDILDIYHRLGLRMLGLVWNYRNELGDGAMEVGTGGGLSDFGHAAIRRCEELHVLVDLAHATPATFWQSLEASRRPLIVSHANPNGVRRHPRNLDDDQIIAIAKQGGFLGVQRSPGRVHETEPTLSRFVDHICYLVELVGVEFVGLGLDFNVASGPTHHKDRRFATNEPKHIAGFEQRANMRDVAFELQARGLSENDLRAVMGANFVRILSESLPSVRA